MRLVCYKVNHLLWFWVNFISQVFGDIANLANEIGYKRPKMAKKWLNYFSEPQICKIMTYLTFVIFKFFLPGTF